MLCTLLTDTAAAVIAYSLSIALHLSVFFFATLIHVSLFFISLPFVASVSSGLRNSLISSSHLFLWSPHWSVCLVLVPRPGFHFAVFFVHGLSGNDAILIANRHFILLCVSIQHGIWGPLIIFRLCISVSSSCTPFSFVQLSHFDLVDRHFSSCVRILIAENFRIFRVDFQSHPLCVSFEVTHYFWSCASEVVNKSTSSAKRRFVRKSDS